MAGNKTLGDAKRAKQDEFYTQMADIQAEINAIIGSRTMGREVDL